MYAVRQKGRMCRTNTRLPPPPTPPFSQAHPSPSIQPKPKPPRHIRPIPPPPPISRPLSLPLSFSLSLSHLPAGHPFSKAHYYPLKTIRFPKPSKTHRVQKRSKSPQDREKQSGKPRRAANAPDGFTSPKKPLCKFAVGELGGTQGRIWG